MAPLLLPAVPESSNADSFLLNSAHAALVVLPGARCACASVRCAVGSARRGVALRSRAHAIRQFSRTLLARWPSGTGGIWHRLFFPPRANALGLRIPRNQAVPGGW